MRAFTMIGCVLLLSFIDAGRQVDGQEQKPPTSTAFGDLVELGGQLQIRTADGTLLEYIQQPVMNWSNPTRNAEQAGSIFVWNRNGKPQVIGTIFTFVMNNQLRMKHELHSLSQEPLNAEYRGQVSWKPSAAGVQWKRLSEGAAPTANARSRLIQMRGIARQFTATLTAPDGSKTQLELKPTPLYRYTSEDASVIDGAIFSFAHGTDPEVLMLLEAIEGEGSTSWQYAFARFHYWKVSVAGPDGATVWEAKEAMDLQSVNMGDAQTISRPYVSYYVERLNLAP